MHAWPNNSGKTSVLQTLALLKQSTNQLRFNGPFVKLGTFKDTVHKRDIRKTMTIYFGLSPRDRRIFNKSRTRMIHCHISIKGDKQGRSFISSSILSDDRKDIINYQRDRRRKSDAHARNNIRDTISSFDQVNFSISGIIPQASSGAVNQIEEYNRIYNFIVEELSSYLYYLSARRGTNIRSERVDARFSRRPNDVGLFGEHIIPVLAHIQDDDEYAEAMQKIHFWLQKFGLTKSVAKIVEGKDLPGYSLRVKNQKTRVQSNIIDVGFGVNQLVPVVVQCFYAPKGSLIMMEQPEAHLHPKSQADVADFLIDVVSYGNKVMVETHSEHLLLRLQRRIAEKKISPEVVNFWYFEQTHEGTKPLSMKINENGYFAKPIPEGFFEEGFQEAIAHLRALQPQGGKTGSPK